MSAHSPHAPGQTNHEGEETKAWPYQCLVAQTALVVPFHWGDVGRVPGEKGHLARYLLMDKLLQRFVVHPGTGERLFLWETNRTIPFEIGELSAYLKHILGWDDTVRYFKENCSAKERAFGLGGNGGRSSPRRSHTKRNVGGDEELVEEVVYGEDTKGFEDMELWKCQRLVMNDHVRRSVFPHTCLWAHPNAADVHIESSSNTLGGDPHAVHDTSEAPLGGKEDKARGTTEDDLLSCRVDITKVELILYPLGNGLLVFHVDWKPDPTSPLDLAQLRSWLFMAKFKHKVRGIFYGWTLGHKEGDGSPDLGARGHYFGAHCDSLGKLAHSIYGGAFASLSSIGNWLVHLPSENSLHPPRRIFYSAYANHHTVVVIDRQPSKKHLRDYLRHLTRAFNVNSMTPEVLLPEAMHHHSTLEKILPHRRNRYLGVSVEGNVSFSWLTEDANTQFEVVTWPKVYQGIYLILDLHTRGEASVLSELSRMSAKVAEHMHLCTLDKLEKDRLKLRSVAMQMIKYSLGLSSDVCSGMSEYAQFFTTARKVLGIPEGKQRIREEIEHVLNIVESVYMEEQRRKKQQEKKKAKEKELAQHRIESLKEARRQRFETLISIVGTVTLPLVLVGGIMGMNLHDLPQLGFWPLMGYSALASVGLFLLLMLWYSKVHHFIFRRFWAREMAILAEAEEEEEEPEDKFDEQYPASTLGRGRRGTADDNRGRPQDEAFNETTPLFHRG